MCLGNQTQVSTPATSPVTACPGSSDPCPYALPAAPASTLVAVSAIPEPHGGFMVIYCPIVCAGIAPAFNGLPPCPPSKADVCQDNLGNCKDVLENVKSYREEEKFYELQSRVMKDCSNQLAEPADEIPSEKLKKTRTASSRRVRTNRWPFPLLEVPPRLLPGWKGMP